MYMECIHKARRQLHGVIVDCATLHDVRCTWWMGKPKLSSGLHDREVREKEVTDAENRLLRYIRQSSERDELLSFWDVS